ASRTLAGVSKSGSPISRWMTDRPVASSARARAAASNAVSVPIEAIRSASFIASMIGGRKILAMTRYYAIDEANATLPEVDRILTALRDQRVELIDLRDQALAATPDDGEPATDTAAEDLRLIRLKMQGLIDQMQAGVARLVELDITLRDIAAGLIDFPALMSGR